MVGAGAYWLFGEIDLTRSKRPEVVMATDVNRYIQLNIGIYPVRKSMHACE
jgi:hypothetical protein